MANRLLLSLLVLLAAPPLAAQRTSEQAAAFRLRETGKILPARAIEARVVPQMASMSYLGFEFDARTSVYRLKFMDGRRVVWVDVDGETGRVLGRSG